MTRLWDFSARRLGGDEEPLSAYEGKVAMVVNVASKCGFTPQYKGLEALWQTYGDRGFVVLGFPCNQFGEQEPGEAAEIASFCSTVHGVTFPLFDKIDVNGRAAHPLYVWLKAAAPGLLGLRDVKWNFTKFLVDRTGAGVHRFGPEREPATLAPEIEALL